MSGYALRMVEEDEREIVVPVGVVALVLLAAWIYWRRRK